MTNCNKCTVKLCSACYQIVFEQLLDYLEKLPLNFVRDAGKAQQEIPPETDK